MRSARFAGLLLFSVLIAHGSGWAQSAEASILGRVTDPQGAVVPKTAITVTNVATQVIYTTQTDDQGNYRVLALPIGT